MNLYQDVFFRALDGLRGRQNVRRLRFLRESQFWSRERLRDWQLARLNELLHQARRASSFHRHRLAGIDLPLVSLDQIGELPILTKQEIREHRDAIKTDNLPRWRYVEGRTGGSTGKPMSYFWDKRGKDWNRGSVYRSAEWAGTALGERTVHMSGSQFDQAQARRFVNRAAAAVHRQRHCSVAWVNDEVHERYFQLVNRFRPTSIWGYASGVDLFARYVAEHHGGADFSYLRAVITSSETLHQEQRQRINATFGGAKVFDNYGSREMYVAAECSQHDGYHVHGEVLVVEVIDEQGVPCQPGERGRVILTDLSNHAFPFIRYEIGDMASMAPAVDCRCGVTLPRLRSIDGRIADFVVLGDRTLTPPNFAAIFNEVEGVRAYQIRQERIDEVVVLVEPEASFTDSTRDYIERSCTTLVAGNARVRVVTDRPIEVPESGKRRFVVSSVTSSAAPGGTVRSAR